MVLHRWCQCFYCLEKFSSQLWTLAVRCLQAHQNTNIFAAVLHHLLDQVTGHNTVPFLVPSGTSFIPHMMLLLLEHSEFLFIF